MSRCECSGGIQGVGLGWWGGGGHQIFSEKTFLVRNYNEAMISIHLFLKEKEKLLHFSHLFHSFW